MRENWWRQANWGGPKSLFLYSLSSILEPTRMYHWVRWIVRNRMLGHALVVPRSLGMLREMTADKIRSVRALREPNGTFCDVPEFKVTWPPPQCFIDTINRDHSWLSLEYSGQYSFVLHIALTITLVHMHSSFLWELAAIGCWQCAFNYRILRIPGDEYISSCLWPLRNKYSIAVKSFLPTRIFFWNSALQSHC